MGSISRTPDLQNEPTSSSGVEKPSCSPALRPTIHVTAPHWINDPCAPGYDPSTGLYHLFYQANPWGCEWGNMSWSHVTSSDLLTWKRARPEVALKPDEEYDKDGVFTGCFAPVAAGSQALTVFYSSVCNLPFHWSTPPYPRGAAGLAMATSDDSGRTWQKSTKNPILAEEPKGVEVTGFRDPYLAEWVALDQIRGKKSLYGIISGGIRGAGPTSFLYAVQPENLADWEYLGPLVDLPARFQQSEKWTGNSGINWECTNFMTLTSGSVSLHFLILGAEGDVERKHIQSHDLPCTLPSRTVRGQLWMSGELAKDGNGARLSYQFGGILDHGSYYAANSFFDPKHARRVVYGWIPEEDCTLEHCRRKGWNGSLAFPRELFLLSIFNVTGALRSPLLEISCVEARQEPDGSTTVYTLGLRPIPELKDLRASAIQFHKPEQLFLPQPAKSCSFMTFVQSPAWELEAVVSLQPGCKSVGFHIRHSHDLSARTTVTFNASEEAIIVRRDISTMNPDINKCVEQGPFTLFVMKDAIHGIETLEKLHIRILSDADILEVYANDRFALATMVYFSDDVKRNGITAFATGLEGSAIFENVRIWDGLAGMETLIQD